MTRNQYREYMQSVEWHEKCESVRERSGGVCEKCASSRSVDVHHKTYVRVGRERLEDLIDLCRTCHQDAHGGTDFRSGLTIADKMRPFEHTTFTKRTAWNSGKTAWGTGARKWSGR